MWFLRVLLQNGTWDFCEEASLLLHWIHLQVQDNRFQSPYWRLRQYLTSKSQARIFLEEGMKSACLFPHFYQVVWLLMWITHYTESISEEMVVLFLTRLCGLSAQYEARSQIGAKWRNKQMGTKIPNKNLSYQLSSCFLAVRTQKEGEALIFELLLDLSHHSWPLDEAEQLSCLIFLAPRLLIVLCFAS